MITIKPINILNEEDISIGKRYEFKGEVRYGIEKDNIKELTSLLKKIEKEYLVDVIIFDFTKLSHWDSLGIRAIVPTLLKLNKQLEKKGRVLISIIGDVKSDIYAALKDKHPNISNDNLPWYPDIEKFMNVVLAI